MKKLLAAFGLFIVLFLTHPSSIHAQTCDINITSPSRDTLVAILSLCNPLNDSGNFSIVLSTPDGTTSAPIAVDIASGQAQLPLFIGAVPPLGRYTVLLYYQGRYLSAASYDVLDDGCDSFLPSDAQIFLGSPIALSALNCYPLPGAGATYEVELTLPDGSGTSLTIPVITGATLSYTYIPPLPGTYVGALIFNGTQIHTASFSVIVAPTASPVPIGCAGNPTSIDTAIGCIPYGDVTLFTGFFIRWFTAIGGGIAILLILYAGTMIQTAENNPKKLQAGRELMTAAVAGLIMIIFSVFILRVIGVDVLGII